MEEHPSLLGALDSSGPFWEGIRDNSHPTQYLVGIAVESTLGLLGAFSLTKSAATAVVNGRRSGKISEPVETDNQ